MPIDWRASKQQSVTKSTTEADLYALSCAMSELIWWNNLFDQLNFKTGITPVIYCENQQTIGVVTKASEPLQTKLKHVSLHQLWLRQVVEQGDVMVIRSLQGTALIVEAGFTGGYVSASV
jgi:hypothetical protein